MKVLPKSIAKLYNLQTLRLYGCKCLKELPKRFNEAASLRNLDITSCCRLTNMPKGMSNYLERQSHACKVVMIDIPNLCENN